MSENSWVGPKTPIKQRKRWYIMIQFYIEFVAVTFNVNSDQASLLLGTMSQVSNMAHRPLIYFGRHYKYNS